MELSDYLRILRNRWQIIALCVAVALAAGALFVLASSPRYESQTQLFVSTSAADADPSAIFQEGQFSQARVQSYADIVGGPLVASQVAAQIGGGLTPKTIENEVTAKAPVNTVLLNVTVTDPSARRAQEIATGIGQVFPTIVKQVETPDSNGQSPVKVSVVKPATFSSSPVSPKTPLDISLAFLVGLVVGLGAAVLRESLDNTIKTAEDVQEATGRAAIGVIGFDPDAKSHPLVIVEDTHSVRSEALRQLRTNLQFIDVDVPLRSIVCTSSVPSEGKTTTVCNLAITLANTGMRVLLVEADLRRPRVGLYMGLENAVGLTSVLIGAIGFDEAVQSWGSDGLLDVLPSGPMPPNPSELLGSHGMVSLLRSLEQRYDLVLFDTPPLLPVTDAAVLAVEASGALIVVHHGQTRREQLQNSTQSLTAVGARILGTVINFAPRKGPEAYYYGYAYSYHSKDRVPMPTLRPAADPAMSFSSHASVKPVTEPSEHRAERNGSSPSPATTWPKAPVLPQAVEEPPSAPPAWAGPPREPAQPADPAHSAEPAESAEPEHRVEPPASTPFGAMSSEPPAAPSEEDSPWARDYRDPAQIATRTSPGGLTRAELESDPVRRSFDEDR
ncbi:MAG TPA: polysaccharide biosynthesis tyrosine autokinase [Mycobacteriales bacterium]|nr:polysaccharide biosynthesis tyrosine autokinase [Mycobacteriales bacterium]